MEDVETILEGLLELVRLNMQLLLEMIVESNSDLAWLKDVYGPHKLGKI
jgi:hypothetical protein